MGTVHNYPQIYVKDHHFGLELTATCPSRPNFLPINYIRRSEADVTDDSYDCARRATADRRSSASPYLQYACGPMLVNRTKRFGLSLEYVYA